MLLISLLFPVCENMKSGDVKCPPSGKNGTIDCNSIGIQDINLRKSTCDVLKQHCQVISNSEFKPDINLFNFS